MARGQSDYYSVVLPSAQVFGSGQVTWLGGESGEILASSSVSFVEYTVPVGYQLHVVAGYIVSDFPATQKVFILVSGTPIARIFYDTNYALAIHTAAAYVLDAGEILSFEVYNEDDIAHNYGIGVAGFLVSKGA